MVWILLFYFDGSLIPAMGERLGYVGTWVKWNNAIFELKFSHQSRFSLDRVQFVRCGGLCAVCLMLSGDT